jgi:hypothetical protein
MPFSVSAKVQGRSPDDDAGRETGVAWIEVSSVLFRIRNDP